jgi:phage/conjugal plasmid C-4 type zinc finger TraR family protein
MDAEKILQQKKEYLSFALTRNVEFLREGEDTEEGSAMNLAQMETNELAKINDALCKIQDGTYGICEDCGKKIPKARLNALPHVTRCFPCQQSVESETSVQKVDDSQWERLGNEESMVLT